MNTDNRITGPGYYPRRPTAPDAATITFGGRPTTVRAYAGAGLLDAVFWRGSGTYRIAKPRDAMARVTHWDVIDAGGSLLVSGQCGVLASEFAVRLKNPSPGMSTTMALVRWSYTPFTL